MAASVIFESESSFGTTSVATGWATDYSTPAAGVYVSAYSSGSHTYTIDPITTPWQPGDVVIAALSIYQPPGETRTLPSSVAGWIVSNALTAVGSDGGVLRTTLYRRQIVAGDPAQFTIVATGATSRDLRAVGQLLVLRGVKNELANMSATVNGSFANEGDSFQTTFRAAQTTRGGNVAATFVMFGLDDAANVPSFGGGASRYTYGDEVTRVVSATSSVLPVTVAMYGGSDFGGPSEPNTSVTATVYRFDVPAKRTGGLFGSTNF